MTDRGQLYFDGIRCESQHSQQEDWVQSILESKIAFPTSTDPSSWYRALADAKSSAHKFAEPSVRDLFFQLANPGSGTDAIVARNLPYLYPGTAPTNGKRPHDKNKVSEWVAFGLGALAGFEMFSHPQEKANSIVHEVAPTDKKAHTQSNEGREKFDYHTDNACFRPYQPDFLFLSGLLNKGIATLLLTIEEIKRQTPRELTDLLRQPIYNFNSPESFDFGHARFISDNQPIIYKGDFDLDRITLPGSRSIQTNKQAAEALESFRAHLETLTPHKIVVGPGTILAFRNDRVIHGREPIPEDNERWLQRLYATIDIARYREAVGAQDLTVNFDARLLVT